MGSRTGHHAQLGVQNGVDAQWRWLSCSGQDGRTRHAVTRACVPRAHAETHRQGQEPGSGLARSRTQREEGVNVPAAAVTSGRGRRPAEARPRLWEKMGNEPLPRGGWQVGFGSGSGPRKLGGLY